MQEIEQYQGLRSLRLEGNTLGVEAARAIAKSLEAKRELEVLLNCPWKIFTLSLCFLIFAFFFAKQCHWSDMFTGRLRSEIPPALVRQYPSQKAQLNVFAVSKKLVLFPTFYSNFLDLVGQCFDDIRGQTDSSGLE